MQYIEPLFRPPSEAQSLIVQVTNGCSWNRCRFCEMYTAPQKAFHFKPIAAIVRELRQISTSGFPVRRVFLADGDAMTLSTRRLREILWAIRTHLPAVERISSYCLPRNLRHKTPEELAELKDLGLRMLYVGCESGCDTVLEMIDKGETFASSADALDKIRTAGITASVMILNGLGGQTHSHSHALKSAQLMNIAQPDYLSTLVLSFPRGEQRFQKGFAGQFKPLSSIELIEEMGVFMEVLNLDDTVFRSDHASNYLVLKGRLNRDKDKLLSRIQQVLRNPSEAGLRAEHMRGL